MASTSLVRQIETLFEGGSAAGLSDRQLLERFATARDEGGEAAFAALVARHGPMVLGVCRQLLGDHQHAEDAFQAVFLVLARKAPSLREPDLLGNWLYGVALRTARKARGRLARRRRIEERGAASTAEACRAIQPEPLIEREQAEALHREIDRLPGAFRLPIVLCYFEGLSPDEAAARLRWPGGTLRSRLVRAREKLRRGLLRRGVVLSATAMAAALAPRSASASVSSLLCDSTTRAAIAFAARHAAAGGPLAAPAATMAREVLRSMLIHKLKLTAMALCVLVVVATGTGWLIRPTARANEPRRAPAAAQAPAPAKPDDPDPRPAPGRMTVAGRVLDPSGKPVPDAAMMVLVRSKFSDRPMLRMAAHPGASDRSGRFRIDLPRTTSAQHDALIVTALAPGYGIGWVRLGPDEERPTADIALRPEQVIRGRLFDLHGQPARGVALWVFTVGPIVNRDILLSTEIVRPDSFERPWHALAGWPGPAISDDQGRFTLRSLGPGLRCAVVTDDSRYSPQQIVIQTGATGEARNPRFPPVIEVEPGPDAKPIAITLQPARTLIGRVTYADTGRPVPRAQVNAGALHSETDGEGRFRVAVPGAVVQFGSLRIRAQAPGGAPYLSAWKNVEWPKEAVEQAIDIALIRGVVIRGKVVEEGTGRLVSGAGLRYLGRPAEADEFNSWSGPTRTGPDGSYQLIVSPKPGTLFVLGPSEDYALQEIGERMAREGRPGGTRWYTHAVIPCDLKPGSDGQEVNAVLRRGATVTARVIGPAGQPVRQARVLSRALLQPQQWPWRVFRGQFHGDVHDGRFELHGVAPDAEVPVFFFDSKNQLGARAIFSVKAAKDGPITVRLEPCGRATGRLVDPKGRPLAGYRDPYLISMIITPGPNALSTAAADQDRLAAEADYLLRIDPDHYTNLIADAQGRVVLPALIPGTTYRVNDMTTLTDSGGRKVRKVFVAGSGQSIELGDILIEKPEP